MLENKNFCIQPWIHLASWNDGSVPLCCIARPEPDLNLNTVSPGEAWNSPQFRSARLQFMRGERPRQCASCWKEEDLGIKSHRMVENNMWQRKLGTPYLENLIAGTHPDGSVGHNPITLDLRIGNTCNLQCVMCRPRDSSKWLEDSKRLAELLESREAKGDWQYKSISISNTDCFDWFERLETVGALNEFMGDIRHIIFGGGEPLLIKEHERFISRLVESGESEHISLRYHTNATMLNDKFLKYWSKFQEVELMLSIDDWGSRNEYVRYPSQWSTIYDNLHKLDDSPDNIVVSMLTTVHAMNIYNLPEFAVNLLNQNFKKVCKKNDGLFSVGFTHWPRYLSTTTLMPEDKREIIEHWDSFKELDSHPHWTTRIKTQLDFMMSVDNRSMYPDLLDYVDKLDSIRPIQFNKLYFDYYEILKRNLSYATVFE